MASKIKDASSNLFTLNQSLKFGENLKSDESSILEDHQEIDLHHDADENREEILRLTEELDSYKKQLNQFKFKNKELKDSVDILEIHNKKHEEKQRELIKKLSHQQISNKQLQFEIKKANEEILRIRQSAKFSDSKNTQASNWLKKSQEERTIFIMSLKKISEAIAKCEKVEEFQSSMSKFLEFIKKNIKIYESADPTGEAQLDLKFQLGQMSSMRAKNNELQNRILKLKDELEKEKLEKKKLSLTFNEKIMKIKEQYDDLRLRLNQIAEKKNEAEVEVNVLKKTITEKNDLIHDLRYRIDSEKKVKESAASKKSRIRKRSYFISDGERDQGNPPLSEIQNEIEDLQRQLIQVIQDFQS